MKQHTVLFDLDDTLIETNILFREKIGEIKRTIEKDTQLDYEIISNTLNESLIRAYQEVSVDPLRKDPLAMKYVKEALNLKDETVHNCLNIFSSIYLTSPTLSEGAIDTLEYFKVKGYKIALVTHATEDWSNLKIDTHGLRKYFNHIEICPVNRHKDSGDWSNAFSKLNIHPEKGMIIGDNIKGDIIAGYSIGVRKLIWINRPEAWRPYSTGDIPEGTIEVSSIKGVPEVLEKQ